MITAERHPEAWVVFTSAWWWRLKMLSPVDVYMVEPDSIHHSQSALETSTLKRGPLQILKHGSHTTGAVIVVHDKSCTTTLYLLNQYSSECGDPEMRQQIQLLVSHMWCCKPFWCVLCICWSYVTGKLWRSWPSYRWNQRDYWSSVLSQFQRPGTSQSWRLQGCVHRCYMKLMG